MKGNNPILGKAEAIEKLNRLQNMIDELAAAFDGIDDYIAETLDKMEPGKLAEHVEEEWEDQ